MGARYYAEVATVDDDFVVERVADAPNFSCYGSEAVMMSTDIERAVGDVAISWLSEPGNYMAVTDDDCWKPDRILTALENIEGDCQAYPEKFPDGFLPKYRPLIDGLRRVAEAARERGALVLTTVY